MPTNTLNTLKDSPIDIKNKLYTVTHSNSFKRFNYNNKILFFKEYTCQINPTDMTVSDNKFIMKKGT